MIMANKFFVIVTQIMILFVYLHYRNGCYGNKYYDKICRYEIF